MKKLKNLIQLIIIFTFSTTCCYSQKKSLDYIVNQKNDTIFGTIRDGFGDKILFEKNPAFKKGGVKYYSHKLKKLNSLFLNDKVYVYKPNDEDGIYAEPVKYDTDTTKFIVEKFKDLVNIKPRLEDYVLTNTNDTIYGQIKNPFFSKKYLVDKIKLKHKIDKESIKEYRYNNDIYQYYEKKKVDIFDNRNAYLKLLYNGKTKLYEYEQNTDNYSQNLNGGNYYFVLRDNELHLIRRINYKEKVKEIFYDNPELISKINDDEYTIENIYLIVKFYNEVK